MTRGLMLGLGIVAAFFSVILFSVIIGNTLWSNELRPQQLSAGQDHSISLNDAIMYTSNFRNHAPAGSVKGEFFGKDAIQSLLGQQGAIGMRIYYGKKADSTAVMVIVGVKADGTDMASGNINERGYPCPPVCDDTSPLSH